MLKNIWKESHILLGLQIVLVALPRALHNNLWLVLTKTNRIGDTKYNIQYIDFQFQMMSISKE